MSRTKKLTLAAMLLALGVIIPQAFHAFPNAGNIILPMHIPVLVSGFVCGPIYGLGIGLLTPILSHLMFSMPSFYMLGQMIIELGCYGLVTGLLNDLIKTKNKIVKSYTVLVIAMIVGRIVYGLLNNFVFKAGSYSLSIWLNAAFLTAIPGIVIQLIVIPIIVNSINKMLQ